MIIRQPRPTAHFTVVDNAILNDERLSWKARGLLVYLLSKPDYWRSSAADLARRGRDGRDAVLAGLNELVNAGYVVRHKTQDNAGLWKTDVLVYDRPVGNPVQNIAPTPDYPTSENPVSNKDCLVNENLGDMIHDHAWLTCEQCAATGWLDADHRCTCHGGLRRAH